MTRLFSRIELTFDWLAALLALGILTGSLLPQDSIPKAGGDQLQHFMAYGVLCSLAVWRRRSTFSTLVMFAVVIAFGIAIELIQPTFGRLFEVRDIAINGIGAIAGLCAVVAARHFINSRE